jgi:hypothetical protein
MPATRDPSQKVQFVYSNLHHLFKKGLDAAKNAELPSEPLSPPVGGVGLVRGKVIKSGNAALPPDFGSIEIRELEKAPLPEVREHKPLNLLGKRIEIQVKREAALPAASLPPSEAHLAQRKAIEELKVNLKNLTDVHARLRFMLKELEDLVKG